MPQISKIRLNGKLYDINIGGTSVVTGVKGEKESEYRHGNVNIRKEDLGCDTTPKNGSSNLITSGGVYSYIDLMITKALSAPY